MAFTEEILKAIESVNVEKKAKRNVTANPQKRKKKQQNNAS